jgi:glycosyltransferase involved in cell wall biosynthesis
MILVLGQNAGLSGAPYVLLHFMKWMKEKKGEDQVMILQKGGPLVEEYSKYAKVFVWNPPKGGSLFQKAFKSSRIQKHQDKIVKEVSSMGVDRIFSNTAINGPILKIFAERLNVPVCTEVHELEFVLRDFGTKGLVEDTFKYSDFIVAVSDAVKQNLINNHNIPAERIGLCNEFVFDIKSVPKEAELKVRAQLGCSDKTILIGGSGTVGWRKGTDLFVRVAKSIKQSKPDWDVKFVWVGGNNNVTRELEMQADIEIHQLEDVVTLTGMVPNPHDYFAAMDLFLMTSREDPFPLVNMEVGLLGKPAICFQNSGGSPELINDECGGAVPIADFESMANRAIYLIENSLLQEKGEKFKAKCEYFTPEHLAPVLYDQLINTKK